MVMYDPWKQHECHYCKEKFHDLQKHYDECEIRRKAYCAEACKNCFAEKTVIKPQTKATKESLLFILIWNPMLLGIPYGCPACNHLTNWEPPKHCVLSKRFVQKLLAERKK